MAESEAQTLGRLRRKVAVAISRDYDGYPMGNLALENFSILHEHPETDEDESCYVHLSEASKEACERFLRSKPQPYRVSEAVVRWQKNLPDNYDFSRRWQLPEVGHRA